MSMIPAGAFNSQVDSDRIWRDSFITRMYGTNNQRGPYFYPESPYALKGFGDIVPMAAMQPIDEDTLFTTLPTPGTTATSTAPIGSAGYPTFQASTPPGNGTVLGPSGATVPENSPASTTVASAMAAGGAPVTGTPTSYTSPYGNPAATLQQAAAGQGPAGPITFENPWPSIVKPPPVQTVTPAAGDSALCQLGSWVTQNPALALAGCAAVYFLFKGGKKR